MLSAHSPVSRDEQRPHIFVEHTIDKVVRHAAGAVRRFASPPHLARQTSFHGHASAGHFLHAQGQQRRHKVYGHGAAPNPVNAKRSIFAGEVKTIRSSRSTEKQTAARSDLAQYVKDLEHRSAFEGFDKTDEWQYAVIVERAHTAPTTTGGDQVKHFGVVFLEYDRATKEMFMQTWKKKGATGQAAEERVIKLHVYWEGTEQDYQRKPYWEATECRPINQQERVAWLDKQHGNVFTFADVEDDFKQLTVGARSLVELAEDARRHFEHESPFHE